MLSLSVQTAFYALAVRIYGVLRFKLGIYYNTFIVSRAICRLKTFVADVRGSKDLLKHFVSCPD